MNQIRMIDREKLLVLANKLVVDHKEYFPGMAATGVEQKGDLLFFQGDYFLDDQGLPREKSTAVFNVFKFLTVKLSPDYRLEQ